MRILFDIVHPGHVHTYRYIYEWAVDSGHEVRVVAREKDVTLELLDNLDIPHETVGRSGSKSLFAMAAELLQRDWHLFKVGRKFKPDVILTRNPAGAQVARLVGAVGIFDTDTGRPAGIHFRAASPFAHIITTPDSINESYGKRHRKYPSYKALAYLHPNRFEPDATVLQELGVDADETFFIVRFVAMDASHDRSEFGMSNQQKIDVVEMLSEKGKVFLTSEGAMPSSLEQFKIRIPPHRLHDALAFASLYCGDSQSMAIEAGLLGTPSFALSSWTRKLDVLDELEDKYQLIESYTPDQFDVLRSRLEQTIAHPEIKSVWGERRAKMLADKCDLTEWYIELIETEVSPRQR